MAASCRHVGSQICKTGRIFPTRLKETWHRSCINRSFGLNSSTCQAPASSASASAEEIVVPRKKTWSKEAVLQALAATVNRDPTASHYMFQDDSYLTPRKSAEFKMFYLSQESGRNAAKYFINSYPRYFQKDFAAPHIPCLMPESVELRIEEVCEAALTERIQLRKVKAAVDMYDQLVQAGSPVSLALTNDLLDLICLYGDHDPAPEDGPEQRNNETGEEQEDAMPKKGRAKRASDLLRNIWRENNNAERIFNMMTERNSRSYGALIRGMVKHAAYAKAFDTFTDLLNNRLTADVHTFNALISAASDVKEKHIDKWELIVELLKQMTEQKVKPNLLTFNSVLKALRRCGFLGRSQAFLVINEMSALGIAPSLATYEHLLGIYYKAASSAQINTDVLRDVLDEVSGKSFTAQDPDDVQFFMNTMRICLDCKDMEQAYKLHSLLGVGENWKLLGDSYRQSIYYGRFFNLLCMMEHVDVVLKWYRELIPSLYYPNSQGMRDLLQALDTDNRLDLIPQIWKDIKQMGHDNKEELVEEMLALMAREKQSPEVQQLFADCALEVKSLYTQDGQGRVKVNCTAGSLSSITSILLEAERTQPAWEMLKMFQASNRVPSENLLHQFLASIKAKNDPQQAIELVKISASFCLPITPTLTERVQQEFELTEEQKNILSDLESSSEDSD